jgi:hypothetical protein
MAKLQEDSAAVALAQLTLTFGFGRRVDRDGLAEPTMHDGADHLLSTFGGQAGILGVHSVLRESLCQATSAFPVRTEWTTS